MVRYELVDFIKERMKEVVGTEIIQKELGHISVLAIFRTDAKGQIIGGRVQDGVAVSAGKVTILRNHEFVGSGEIMELQSGKQVVKQVDTGQECGLSIKSSTVVMVGDILRMYTEAEVMRQFD